MPSFGHEVTGGAPNSLATLVSFSQNRAAGDTPSGPGAASSSIGPQIGCSSVTRPAPAPTICGRSAPGVQDQVLRNQAVGSTCSSASSGPGFVTSIVIRMSSGPALV